MLVAKLYGHALPAERDTAGDEVFLAGSTGA
jgi:hypothetical protein